MTANILRRVVISYLRESVVRHKKDSKRKWRLNFI